MKNRLSFGLTATIMVASYFLYLGLLLWLQTALNLSDWVETIGNMFFSFWYLRYLSLRTRTIRYGPINNIQMALEG